MVDLSTYARQTGLKALTVEPMSCLAEPPTLPEEITRFMTTLETARSGNRDGMVPVYICGDMAHGYADVDGNIICNHIELFEHCIPWTWEFHIKNTDALFNSTFGFSDEDIVRGVVDLRDIRELVDRRSEDFPVSEPIGYFETSGPKLGRDYSDCRLSGEIEASVSSIRELYVRNALPVNS
jgi:hypothetical protein